MKKLLILLALLLLSLALVLTACELASKGETNNPTASNQSNENETAAPGGNNAGNETPSGNEIEMASEGLEYTSNGDGTCFV